jgi:hypothetical protein
MYKTLDGTPYSEPKRFRNALFIQQGACNPSGVARSLAEACSECLAESVSQKQDPAVRLIGHQLAHILMIDEINYGLSVYCDLLRACEDQAKVKTEAA